MKNPFELILKRLERIKIAINKLNTLPQNEEETFLSRVETAKQIRRSYGNT